MVARRAGTGDDAAMPEALLTCVADDRLHADQSWPLMGADELTVGLLSEGVCPICRTVPLDKAERFDRGAPAQHLSCSCCKSAWRLTGDEYECLPGARTEFDQPV